MLTQFLNVYFYLFSPSMVLLWLWSFQLVSVVANTVSREGQGSVLRGQELLRFQCKETGHRPKRL